jgi:predicted dehydrogenase
MAAPAKKRIREIRYVIHYDPNPERQLSAMLHFMGKSQQEIDSALADYRKRQQATLSLSIAPPTEPKTPEEWQTAVDAADALLHIQSAEACGLITGAPHVNAERCEQLLEAARKRGVTPSAGNVERYIAAYNEGRQ